jgi:hypothetical protein
MRALEIKMNIDVIFEFLGKVIAYGGGGAVVAYLLFQYLGKSWIENKFAERLEQMRHDQALEIQKLRVEIESLLSGAIKLQEREFEVLPGAWEKLDEAHKQVSSLVAPLQTYADVDRMSDVQLNEFLEDTDYSQSQKDRIINSSKRSEDYQDILFWHRLHKVKVSFGELQSYVNSNGIFLESELKEKLTSISDTLWSAIVSKEIGHESKDYKMQTEGWKKIKDETDPLYKEIEDYIHNRLQSHGQKPKISNK